MLTNIVVDWLITAFSIGISPDIGETILMTLGRGSGGGELYLGSQAYFQLIFRSCYKIPQNMDHQNDLLIEDYL